MRGFVTALLLVVAAWSASVAGTSPPCSAGARVDTPTAARGPIRSVPTRIPFGLEPNRGQAQPGVDYVARCGTYMALVRQDGLVLAATGGGGEDSGPESGDTEALRSMQLLRMRLDGADASQARASRELPGRCNYLIGSDADAWIRGVPRFGAVRYEDVYPGIDALYREGSEGRLRFDFHLDAGADPAAISLSFQSARAMRIDDHGSLRLDLGAGEFTLSRPRAFQHVEGSEVAVVSSFVRRGDSTIGIAVGAHDPRRPLVIDPEIGYATYFGGSGQDIVYGVAIGPLGVVYSTGETVSTDLPTTSGAYQESHGGGNYDAFVAAFESDGAALVYATFLGGTGGERGNGVRVDASGRAYACGETRSTDFPVRSAAVSSNDSGATYGFVTQLNADGDDIVYSTYVDEGIVRGIALDGSGRIHYTAKADFVYVVKLAADGGSKLYTFQGGVEDSVQELPFAIALDGSGNAYVTGSTGEGNFPTTSGAYQSTYNGNDDAFVMKVDASGTLVWSTLLGGASLESSRAIAVDGDGRPTVGGFTRSSDFPTASPYQDSLDGTLDGFVARFNASGTALEFSTYLGGSSTDSIDGVGVHLGKTFATGFSTSSDFPMVDAIDDSHAGSRDMVIAVFDQDDTLEFSSYLGGTGSESAVSLDARSGLLAIGGVTGSSALATTGSFQEDQAGDSDGFVVQVRGISAPVIETLSLPDWTVERPYSVRLEVAGGTPPHTWTVTSGDLPAGGTLGTDGELLGPFTQSGTFDFTVEARDAFSATATTALSLHVNPAMEILTESFPDCSAFLPTQVQLEHTGGTPPFMWSVSAGQIHLGGFDTATGAIDGVVGPAGEYAFTLRVTDAAGAIAERDYDVSVVPAPTIEVLSLRAAAVGRPYRRPLRGSGGAGITQWKVSSGSFPPGLALDADSGLISGTPTLAGNYAFTLRLEDECGGVDDLALVFPVAEVVDLAEGKAKQEVFFTSATSTAPRTFALELLAGTELAASFTFPTQNDGVPFDVRLARADGTPVDISSLVKAGKRKVTFKGFVVPQGDRYFLSLEPLRPLQVRVRLQTIVKPRKVFEALLALETGGNSVQGVAALPGARLTVTAKAEKGSSLLPTIESVLDGDGAEVLVPTELKVKKGTATLKMRTPVVGGDLRVTFGARDGTLGTMSWRVKIKSPKGYGFSLADLVAGTPGGSEE